jgi:hypothetical protein
MSDLAIITAKLCEALARLEAAEAECARLQRVIDSRPAINAGLPETYIEWSRGVYALEIGRAAGVTQN